MLFGHCKASVGKTACFFGKIVSPGHAAMTMAALPSLPQPDQNLA
jgi:hypothetical protein